MILFCRNLTIFEQDEEAHRQHLENLAEIEQELDAEFGTIGEGSDVSAGGSGVEEEQNEEAEDEDGKLRCIVCEKNFKSKYCSLYTSSSSSKGGCYEIKRVSKEN